jgi:hypothetical protein
MFQSALRTLKSSAEKLLNIVADNDDRDIHLSEVVG